MSKEFITLTRKQWKRLLSTSMDLANTARETHGTTHVEELLTRIAGDFDLMEADSSYPVEANSSAGIVAGIIQDQTCEVNKLAAAFRDYVWGLEVERAQEEHFQKTQAQAEKDAA